MFFPMISGEEKPNSIAFIYKMVRLKYSNTRLALYAAFESLIHFNKVIYLKR